MSGEALVFGLRISDFAMNAEPRKVSMHQAGFQEVLASAQLSGEFPDLIAPTLISCNTDQIRSFVMEQGRAVLCEDAVVREPIAMAEHDDELLVAGG